jgi:hypothetical protein
MFLGTCVILYCNCIPAANSIKVPKTECSLLGIYDTFETSRMSYAQWKCVFVCVCVDPKPRLGLVVLFVWRLSSRNVHGWLSVRAS